MHEYIQAFFGGCLIGLSAVLLMYLIGRISGISGILWSAISFNWRQSKIAQQSWPWAFVVGLPIGALVAQQVWRIEPSVQPGSSTALTLIAGLLVGIGTKLGSGCTSGHGVCGISRVSRRSLVATSVFMAVGIITVFMVRLIGGMQ